jgi:hypothetical protein
MLAFNQKFGSSLQIHKENTRAPAPLNFNAGHINKDSLPFESREQFPETYLSISNSISRESTSLILKRVQESSRGPKYNKPFIAANLSAV